MTLDAVSHESLSPRGLALGVGSQAVACSRAQDDDGTEAAQERERETGDCSSWTGTRDKKQLTAADRLRSEVARENHCISLH